jgi:hypothetical protein
VAARQRWSAGGSLVGRVASSTSPLPSPLSLLYDSSELCGTPVALGPVWASPSVLSPLLRPR